MINKRLHITSLLALVCLASQGEAQSLADRYRDPAARIISRALKDSAAWNRIATLTETFGHRFSGSESLERAINWTLAEMNKDGLDGVRGEPVMVPRWVRGTESIELMSPRYQVLPM